MPAGSHADERCTAEGIAGAGRIQDVHGNAGQVRGKLALYDSRAIGSAGNKKCLPGPGVDGRHRAEQTHGLFFVHKEQVGTVQNGGCTAWLFANEIECRSRRD